MIIKRLSKRIKVLDFVTSGEYYRVGGALR
jgi:hypothetical protein